MSRLLLCCFLLLQYPASIIAQQATPKPDGRYQLISTTITTSGTPDQIRHIVFLLDTQTGQVWRYFEGVGGSRQLKPQDQFPSLDSSNSTIIAISPGGFVLVPQIDLPPSPAKLR